MSTPHHTTPHHRTRYMTYLVLIVVAQKMTCVYKCVKHWIIVLFITCSWSPPQPLIPLTSHGRGCRSRSISLALQTTEEPCKLLQGLVCNIQWRICYCILSCIHNITYMYVGANGTPPLGYGDLLWLVLCLFLCAQFERKVSSVSGRDAPPQC